RCGLPAETRRRVPEKFSRCARRAPALEVGASQQLQLRCKAAAPACAAKIPSCLQNERRPLECDPNQAATRRRGPPSPEWQRWFREILLLPVSADSPSDPDEHGSRQRASNSTGAQGTAPSCASAAPWSPGTIHSPLA